MGRDHVTVNNQYLLAAFMMSSRCYHLVRPVGDSQAWNLCTQ